MRVHFALEATVFPRVMKSGAYGRERRTNMNCKKILALLCMMTVLGILLTGCGKKAKEQWAYIHEPEKPALSFYEDGSAEFKDVKYTSYEITDKLIKLTDKKGTVSEFEYYDDGNQRYVYEGKNYRYAEGDDNTQLVGVWISGESSFEFTNKGTFMEDGTFPGYYRVQEDGKILLIYNDPFPDTVLKYELKDGGLTIYYPWPMTKFEKK